MRASQPLAHAFTWHGRFSAGHNPAGPWFVKLDNLKVYPFLGRRTPHIHYMQLEEFAHPEGGWLLPCSPKAADAMNDIAAEMLLKGG
jgi:hypothetical protein